MISRFKRRDSSTIASDSFNSAAAKSCSPEERKTLHRQAQQLARAELKQVATARGIPVDSLGPPSEEDFRAFRKAHDQDYEVLDRACDALTSRETRVGAYTV